ncbi:MAG: hypothetical protein QOG76_5280, partial [Pseudonocardiales bacterium]|nr:hypothetical protein [Pseudonocardiales bacterium]
VTAPKFRALFEGAGSVPAGRSRTAGTGGWTCLAASAGFDEPHPPDTGAVRSDLISVFRGFARALDQPHGRALRPLMTQRPRYPELFAEIQRLLVKPRLEVVMDILRAGVERGEVAADAVRPRIAAVGPRLLIAEHMDSGPLTDAEIEAAVTEILLPLLTAGPGTS